MSIIDPAFYKFRYSNISILIILGKAISAYIFHKKFIFLTLVFVLFFKCISGFAFAQTVRLFDGQVGVENATINGFAQDTDGFLYVGTETGLYVSSGGEFTRVDNGNAGTFTHVTALAGGEDDNLLIAADHTVWLRNKQSFHKISLKFQDHLHFSALDKDFIVLAGEGPAKGGGLWRIHPKSGSEPVVERFIDGSINGIRLPKSTIATKPLYAIASSEQTVWLACGDAICRYKDGVSIVFGLHEGVPSDKWLALIPDKNKGLIARSTTRIVHINTDKSVELENVPGNIPGTSTYNPFLISTAGGQVITQGASTLFIRSLAGQWESSDFLSKYKSGLISVAFVDREDGIWFARSDHGIMRVAGFAEWKNYGADQGFPAAMISAVKRDNSGALWLATDKGIFRYASLKENGGRLAEFNHYDINATSLLRAGDGTIWAAGKTSFLIHIDPITKKITSLASQVPLTGAMALDSADRLWIGTAQGLIRIDDPVHPPARLPEILGLNERRINALRFDQYGRLLILTDSVLFRQKSGTDYFEPRVDLLDLGIGEGRSMAVTMSNEIWIAGLIGGIRQITLPEEGNAVISSLFTGSQHIEQVTSIFRDSRGWMWVGSNHGVNVLRSNGWRHFDIDSGLISNQIIQGSVSENDDGSLWLGTDIGFSHLDTELIAPSLPDIHTVILSAYMGSIDL
ncbi:two-component regulator propeller domain-containing protein, partial [Acetobacter oeni]